ncbi:MAG: hypothetical protein ACTSO2_19580 [Promethearchaeota archaeon]
MIKGDNGLKWGCTEFKMIKRVRIPKITLIQKVAFGILCSLETCTDQKYKKWAEDWLQNKDRTTETAKAAAITSWVVAEAEVRVASWVTAQAARVAWIVARAAQIAAGEVEINLVRLATECLKY